MMYFYNKFGFFHIIYVLYLFNTLLYLLRYIFILIATAVLLILQSD